MIACKEQQELPSAGARGSRVYSAALKITVLAGCSAVQTADLRTHASEKGELIPGALDDFDLENGSVACEADARLAASAAGEQAKGHVR